MRIVMALAAALLLELTMPVFAAQASSPPPAAELASRLQAHYNKVRDFTADFTQHFRGAVLRQSITERGHVRIKKPGRMDWVYTSPEKKEIVSDGAMIYTYIAADKSVFVSEMPPDDQAPTALLFLTGRGDLVRDFRPALPATQPAGGWQLDLTPKTSQAEFTSLSLVVDPQTLVLRAVTSTDAQGGVSTFEFSNLRENTGLSDNQFTFKIPKGAEIRR
jgi:outer membrane lipoprotein carrier protein